MFFLKRSEFDLSAFIFKILVFRVFFRLSSGIQGESLFKFW